MIIECGDRGVVMVVRVSRLTKWASDRSDIHERRVVSGGTGGGDIIVLRHFLANHLLESIVNVTGAGGTLVGPILPSFF